METVMEPKAAATAPQATHSTEVAGLPPSVAALVNAALAPKVLDIDTKAYYPEAFLRELAGTGAYAGVAAASYGGNGAGLRGVIEAMDTVSRTCMSTGFMVWCQTAAARYLDQCDNTELKARVLPRIVAGDLLAGTGLSNTVKSCDAIEESRLKAVRVEGGYRVTGVLP